MSERPVSFLIVRESVEPVASTLQGGPFLFPKEGSYRPIRRPWKALIPHTSLLAVVGPAHLLWWALDELAPLLNRSEQLAPKAVSSAMITILSRLRDEGWAVTPESVSATLRRRLEERPLSTATATVPLTAPIDPADLATPTQELLPARAHPAHPATHQAHPAYPALPTPLQEALPAPAVLPTLIGGPRKLTEKPFSPPEGRETLKVFPLEGFPGASPHSVSSWDTKGIIQLERTFCDSLKFLGYRPLEGLGTLNEICKEIKKRGASYLYTNLDDLPDIALLNSRYYLEFIVEQKHETLSIRHVSVLYGTKDAFEAFFRLPYTAKVRLLIPQYSPIFEESQLKGWEDSFAQCTSHMIADAKKALELSIDPKGRMPQLTLTWELPKSTDLSEYLNGWLLRVYEEHVKFRIPRFNIASAYHAKAAFTEAYPAYWLESSFDYKCSQVYPVPSAFRRNKKETRRLSGKALDQAAYRRIAKIDRPDASAFTSDEQTAIGDWMLQGGPYVALRTRQLYKDRTGCKSFMRTVLLFDIADRLMEEASTDLEYVEMFLAEAIRIARLHNTYDAYETILTSLWALDDPIIDGSAVEIIKRRTSVILMADGYGFAEPMPGRGRERHREMGDKIISLLKSAAPGKPFIFIGGPARLTGIRSSSKHIDGFLKQTYLFRTRPSQFSLD